jgi:hypothetical protein
MDPRMRALIEVAFAAGATLRDGKHYVLCFPSGKRATVPKSPSDYRGILNNYHQLRRALKEEGLLK